MSKVNCPRCGHGFWQLRPSELKILSFLSTQEEVRFSEIKNATNLSSPSLSEALRFLCKIRFIKKTLGHYKLSTTLRAIDFSKK